MSPSSFAASAPPGHDDNVPVTPKPESHLKPEAAERPGSETQPRSQEVVSRARFNRLVLPHIDAAYNLARWLCGHDDHAADIAQEALLRAFRYRDGIRDESARAWLLAIVRNTFLTTLNAHKHYAALHEEYVEEAHGGWTDSADSLYQKPHNPEESLIQKSDRVRINACLEALPLIYREVIVLRDIEDLAYRDLARVLGVPIGTVMSRLARGRRMLAARLSAEGGHK